ncbi:MAG: hypothetical protein KAJ12_01385, partial [Bacteroidetes bacterium]|nr:hypothetical protein [Bacteroidota bacterium]
FFGGIDFWTDDALAPLHPIREELSLLHGGMSRDSILLLASRMYLRVDSLERTAQLAPLARRIVARWKEVVGRIVGLSCGISQSFRLADPVLVPKQEVGASLLLQSTECDVADLTVRLDLPRAWSIGDGWSSTGSFGEQGQWSATVVVGDNPARTLPATSALYRPLRWEEGLYAHLSYTVDGYLVRSTVRAGYDIVSPHVLTAETERAWLAPSDAGSGAKLRYSVSNHLPHLTTGTMRVDVPVGWKGTNDRFAIREEDGSVSGSITVFPPGDVRPGEYIVTLSTDFASEAVSIRVFEVSVAPGIRVGIIGSYDTTLESAVKQLGLEYAVLGDQEVAEGDLSEYSTIIVDIRAYLVRDVLRTGAGRLLDYVHQGGNLIVMYQRTREWKPEYAPYPFMISRLRITNEDAPVSVLVPDHPLLRRPNEIGNEDWAGWTQERGLYFPAEVGSEYARLLSSRDPDEPELTTGYLVAKWGRGSYIYTSYVWYRQLRQNHPGAFR